MKNITQTTTIALYNIRELSQEAKRTAYRDWRDNTPYDNQYDLMQTIGAFCGRFRIVLVDGDCFSGKVPCMRWRFLAEYADKKDMKGQELADYIMDLHGEVLFMPNGDKRICPLTGYYADYITLQPIYTFLENPDDLDLELLVDQCVDAWAKLCYRDLCEYYSYDKFLDECYQKNYLFLSNGRRY